MATPWRWPPHRAPPAPYNQPMRAIYLFLLLGLGTSVFSQNTAQNAPHGMADKHEQLPNQELLEGRTNQRTERIQIEDGGSRVDELRIGGQTRSITVQPKTGDMPEYEIQSPDGTRNRSGSRNGSETNTAPRVWNLKKF